MTGVDAHGLLREQITKLKHLHRNWGSEQLGDSVRLCSSEGTSYPCQTAGALEGIEELVEAAIAAARRDALESAADAVSSIPDGVWDPVQWLRARAAEGEAEREFRYSDYSSHPDCTCPGGVRGTDATCDLHGQRAQAPTDVPAERRWNYLQDRAWNEAVSPQSPAGPAAHEFGRTPGKGVRVGSRHGLCLVCGQPDSAAVHQAAGGSEAGTDA